ncbi:glycosyltransferase family 2 protein [Acinetobacter haemolyticus]|uniref:glycosyltransferase family 2 protein n=1 Tax=Acinetobacter haemolyticus TaxID=29430 RepID=UPI003EF6E750
MTAPLLSVIIPTHNRPQYLPRAVESALQAAPNGNVEVIVVPNGGDETWKESLATLLKDKRIIVSPIEKGHANAARNHGMKLAQGKYIRFLDDDDFLVDGAIKQLESIEKVGVDMCGGALAVMDAKDTILNILNIPYQNDFIASLLSSKGRTGIQFYLYRRESIQNFFWDESIHIGQDTHWTHTMCRTKDWTWICIDEVVSSWVQHSPEQISKKYNLAEHFKLQEAYKWSTVQTLIKQGRLTDERGRTAVEGMWSLIHGGFFFAPFFWAKVMKKTQKLFPNTYPNIPIYKGKYKKIISPLYLEIIMIPKRWLNYFYRQYLVSVGKRSNWS